MKSYWYTFNFVESIFSNSASHKAPVIKSDNVFSIVSYYLKPYLQDLQVGLTLLGCNLFEHYLSSPPQREVLKKYEMKVFKSHL